MSNNKINIEKQALNLLEKAFSLAIEDQEAFLITNTVDDNVLRKRVLILWNTDKSQVKMPSTGSGLEYVERASRPTNIGSFSIIDELGSGGMGSVYLGKKVSDDFEFYAAIKVIRKGSCSEHLITRLKSERKTLANLSHPNIAHFYDGGETEKGEPFFVMEYVKGQKLSEYVQGHVVSIERQLSIFKEVCSAVAFAHQNLVIHRDLTPANIIVSEDGSAKLIDFGIAHSLGDIEDTISSEKTGTQGYVAPERSQGHSASTITDIYSLGIILKALIDNADFPRKEDVIAITKKAAHRMPERRYQSVDVLMKDLKRYETRDAVEAVEKSWLYVTKRFVSRHRLLVGTITSIFIISLLSSILISISYFRVEAAEERSHTRFNEVRELANFMMFDLYDEVVKLDTSLAAREVLINTTLNYLDRLSGLPEAPQDLKIDLSLGYQRMADIAGGTGAINLGERGKAKNLYAEAKKQIESAYLINPNDPETIRAYAKIYRNIGTFEWVSNLDFDEANRHFSLAKSALKNLLSSKFATIDDHVMDGALSLSLSQSARNVSDFERAISWSNKGINKLSELYKRHPSHYETQFNLAHAYIYLGEAITTKVYQLGGDISEAISPFDQGKHHLEALIAHQDAPTLAKAQYLTALYKRSVAACQLSSERKGALIDLKTAEELALKLLNGEAHNNFVEERLLITLETYAECELLEGNDQSSLNIAKRLVKKRQEKFEKIPKNPLYISRLLTSQLLLAKISLKMNQLDRACAYFQQGNLMADKFEAISKASPSFQFNSHINEVRSGFNNCLF